jgi:hypothetical protein
MDLFIFHFSRFSFSFVVFFTLFLSYFLFVFSYLFLSSWSLLGTGVVLAGNEDEYQRSASDAVSWVAVTPFLFEFNRKIFCRDFLSSAELTILCSRI